MLTRKRYNWLTDNFPDASRYIRESKDRINLSTAHANIVYTAPNFRPSPERQEFDLPFFDIEDDYYVRTDLWTIGSIGITLMNLFCGVNHSEHVIDFVDDFVERLTTLGEQNSMLQQEMLSDERSKRIAQDLARHQRDP